MGLTQIAYLAQGLSYWQVKLKHTSSTRRKTFSELDMSFDPQRGVRPIDWALDIVGAGDTNNIEEITLCTPQGDVSMPIIAPKTAFQFKRGTMDLLTGQKIIQAQIIGRLENRETGACTACIWDVMGHEEKTGAGVILPDRQHLFLDFSTTIDNFAAWHEDVIPPGAMYPLVIGL